MVIKILGAGCANCQRVEATAREIIRELGIDAQVEHVTDYKAIMAYGVMATPAVVINEKLVSAGRVPSKAEMTSWITTALSSES